MSILVFIAIIVCVVDRMIIFHQRDIKWWEALIPFRNKYIYGKLCNQKLIGVITALASVAWTAMLVVIYEYETYLINRYYAGVYSMDQLILEVPEQETVVINILRIIVMVVAAIYMTSWTYMMYKFSAMHGKSPKWILGWAIAPVFFLTYIALDKNIAMYGKKYVMVRLDADKAALADKKPTNTNKGNVKNGRRRKV